MLLTSMEVRMISCRQLICHIIIATIEVLEWHISKHCMTGDVGLLLSGLKSMYLP